MGFTFTDHAAGGAGDPCLMSPSQRKDVTKMYRDLGLRVSQMLLVHCQHVTTSDPEKRRTTLDYMKRCAEFQLELGGKQVLMCWGCGVHLPGIPQEAHWMNAVSLLREYAAWCLDKGILIDFEIEPHVYFVINSTVKAAQLVEDVGHPNLFPNVDIGHLCITREAPDKLEKLRDKILHVHLSETDTYEHTNSILGTGNADLRAYVDKVIQLGIEDNCAKYGEVCAAGVELGSMTLPVDNPDRWVKESLDYVRRILPELKQ
jgi:sugar phosphate isomerase/epimerase